MGLLTGAIIASSAFSMWSSWRAGEQQASAYKDSARAKKAQAARFMERFEMNAEFTRLEGRAFAGKQTSEFAKRGVDVGSGASLKAFEDTARKIERRIEVDRIMAQNQAEAIISGANIDMKQAGISRETGMLGAFSAGLGGISSLAMTGAFDKKG